MAGDGGQGSTVRREDRGAAAVEFALIAPLFIVLLFGIIDYGWAFGQRLGLTSAVREGARLAVVNADSGATPDARRDSIIAAVKSRATTVPPSGISVSVALEDGNGNGTVGDVGDTVVVCAHYPIHSISGLGGTLYPSPGGTTVKAVMRLEQQANFSSGSSTSPAFTESCSS
jgi:Flp pilus assembly protein TadG